MFLQRDGQPWPGSFLMAETTESADTRWRSPDRKWWVLAVVGAGTFMSALDGSVVNTALPVIGRTTGAPVSTLEWVVLIYLLTASSSLLVFGRLADIYGQRGIYITGLAVFVGGSVLCGLSPSVAALIGFRALQALGAAILFALAPAVLTGAFPGQERGRALGLQATMTYLGLSTGPALGGFLTHHFGWPSIFFINVPIGAVVISVALRVLRLEVSGSRQPFDPAGAAALAISMAALLLALSKGGEIGWRSPLILASVIVAAAGFASFVAVERRIRHPVLDLKLFANRTFTASTTAAFLNYMATSSVNFLMPFYLILASNYEPDAAGLALIATPLTMAVLAGPSGWLSDRIGQRLPATLGMALTVTGMLFLRTLHAGSTLIEVTPRLALIGLGVGLFTSPNNSAIMGSAPGNRQGVAGAILAAARNTGFAMGVAVSGLIYTTRLGSLATSLPRPEAITRAMQDATTGIALVAIVGVLISALRGSSADEGSLVLSVEA